MKTKILRRMMMIMVLLGALVGLMSTGAFAADTIASGTCGEHTAWTLDSDGVLTIAGSGEMENVQEQNAPWLNTGHELKEAVITEGVTGIGEAAFYACEDLTSIEIPDSVTVIGANAFSGCTKLESVQYEGTADAWAAIQVGEDNESLLNAEITYDACVHDLAAISEQETTLEDMTLPKAESEISWTVENGVLVISGSGEMEDYSAMGAPWYDQNLTVTKIVISDGLTSVGSNAFFGFHDVRGVFLASSVTSVGYRSFDSCTRLTTVYYGGSVAAWKNVAIGSGNWYIQNKPKVYNSTGYVAYVDGQGTEQKCYLPDMVSADTTSMDGWYAVSGNVTIDSNVTISGDLNLILMDGATLTVNGFKGWGQSLTVYKQTGGTGKLVSSATIYVGKNISIYGGTVEASAKSGNGIYAGGDMTISGGKVIATGTDQNAAIQVNGKLTVENAEVTATGGNGTVTCGGKVEGGVRIVNSTASFIGGTITGSSSSASSIGLRVIGDVSTSNSQLTFGGGSIGKYTGASRGLYVKDGSVTISGGKLHAYSSKGNPSNALVGIHLAEDDTKQKISFMGDVDANIEGSGVGLLGTSSDVNISGNAKVNITGSLTGLEALSLSVWEWADVTVTGQVCDLGSHAIIVKSLGMGSDGKLTATSENAEQASVAITTTNLNVVGGELTAISKGGIGANSVGIYLQGGTASVTRGTVTAVGGPVTSGTDQNMSCGLFSPSNDMVLLGGSLTTTGGKVEGATSKSYGMNGTMKIGGGVFQASGVTRALYKAPQVAIELNVYYWRTSTGADYNISTKQSYAFDKGQTYVEISEFLPSGFVDVLPGKYYTDAVSWAVANEITNGTSATTFSPNNACNRGQIVVFLWRMAGKPIAQNRNNPFTDVKEGSFCYEAVLWAAEQGITTGKTATTFCPAETCNRGQIVTFLWRYAGKPAPENQNRQFTDVAEGSFCDQAVMWAVENQITLGMKADTFAPGNPCTRGHAVTFLYRGRELLKK